MSERNEKGQFTAGNAGGPGGARQRKTPEQRMLSAIERDAPALVERALIVAQTDNAVLAEVMRYLSECLATRNLEKAAELQAVTYAAASGGVRH
ncbi:TPA: hypothetical protein R2K55_005775 [Raoultella ornithinolytica]|uniref:hypothetical protein n=1 Tax=Raoultella ornithinolytica TaxID=54291 RepID=UPI00273F0D08|nr:hypothetical protein [Raoultella ornithinolytica]WLP46284.1 hypothetical protein Q7A27_00265 [Raoultella ornithinolytica]HEC2553940.1 hypothetical protein [Raoultella ornithinolytica]HEC2606745.1 hypothetical protein [Raoultella ornithinolytica]HEC2611325.1 hypothetical protein [Raoultella ornithinolytica]